MVGDRSRDLLDGSRAMSNAGMGHIRRWMRGAWRGYVLLISLKASGRPDVSVLVIADSMGIASRTSM
jgi:hypothetical protein